MPVHQLVFPRNIMGSSSYPQAKTYNYLRSATVKQPQISISQSTANPILTDVKTGIMYQLVKIDANGTPIYKEYKNKSDGQELDRLSEKSTRPHSPATDSNCANPAKESKNYIYDSKENQYYVYVRHDNSGPIYKKVDDVINSKFKSLKENIALFNKHKELAQKPKHTIKIGDQLPLNDTIISSIKKIEPLINSSENQKTLFEILNSIRTKFTALQCA